MTVSQRHIWRLPALASVLAAALCPTFALASGPGDAVASFSHSANPNLNPNGDWSYGYKTSLTSALTLYTNTTNNFGSTLDSWEPAGLVAPFVMHNNTATSQSAADFVVPADLLNLHPGVHGERSTVRWTARYAGAVTLQGRFEGLATDNTSTDAGITFNSATSLFSALVNGYGAPSRSTYNIVNKPVNIGDTIDFSVGYGSNNNYGSDSTGLAATITYTAFSPFNLTATVGYKRVSLYWMVGSNSASSYRVKRSTTSGGPYTTIASIPGSGSISGNYVDTNVVNGATYYYVVSEIDGTSESPNSNQISAVPISYDGANPGGQLLASNDFGKSPGMFFYGVTAAGGANGYGSVYSIDSNGGFAILHSFIGSDGSYPCVGLTLAGGGGMYGVTTYGGPTAWGTTYGSGTIFQVGFDSPATFSTVYAFPAPGSSEGYGMNPQGKLLYDGGIIYATTTGGASGDAGTLFRYDPSSLTYGYATFDRRSGGHPYSGLIAANDGYYYGTCRLGPTNGAGSVYKSYRGGGMTLVHEFAPATFPTPNSNAVNADGAYPYENLVQATDGSFYGATDQGGANGGGVMFKVTSAGVFTVVHVFGGTVNGSPDGTIPVGNIVQGTDGNFYGTASSGGVNGAGLVYKVTAAGVYSILHTFNNTDGSDPLGGLVQGYDGYLYGVTWSGGLEAGSNLIRNGTVFRLDTSGGNFKTLHVFH